MTCPKNGMDNDAIKGGFNGCLFSIALWVLILGMSYRFWGCGK